MEDPVQVKGYVPHELKRRFFVLLAEREQSFAEWLRQHMEATLWEEARRKIVAAARQETR